jgi:membrane associated rhomboid family serine protease
MAPIHRGVASWRLWLRWLVGLGWAQRSASWYVSLPPRHMFFPIRDENPTRSVPYLTWLLIAVNVAAHVWIEGVGPANQELLLGQYGLVPRRLLAQFPEYGVTVLTSMFMHGGWYHLLTNMWTLHIFGDNVEDTLGKGRFLVFYLVCGLAAASAQVLLDPSSVIPMVGASGAIGGVVGAYLVLYPRAPILAFNMLPLLWLFFGLVVVVPAWVIGLLFLGQNVMLALQDVAGMGSGSIAFAAHLGGFLAGLLLTPLLSYGRHVERRRWGGLRSARRPTRQVFWRN